MAKQKNRKPVIGILGGMGPYASMLFYKSILDKTPVEKDWDHFRLVIDSNPHIPSRTRSLLYGEETPVRGMVASCLALQKYPVDIICIPCNSAHAWIDEVQAQIDIPILNIIETTLDTVSTIYPKAQKICVIGAHVTWKLRTYEVYSHVKGFEYFSINDIQQRQVEQIIENLKKLNDIAICEKNISEILSTINKDHPNTCFILGCTELTMLYKRLRDQGLFIIDSIEAYSDRVIELS